MGKVMRHTLGASLNIRHNLSSSKGPKPLQLKLLTTYIPKTSAFTLAFSTSQRLRTTRASARTFFTRSEERRVGKECRARQGTQHHEKKRPRRQAYETTAARRTVRTSFRCQFFFSSIRRHTISVSAFLLNRSSDLPQVRGRSPCN